MASKRREGFDLRAAAHDRSYIPARDDLPALIELLANDDDAEAVERAIARAGVEGARVVIEQFDRAKPPLRGRMIKVVARVGGHAGFLIGRLHDGDDKTRRNAIIALGKHDGKEIEAALVASYARETRVDHQRSIVTSLGKVGGEAAVSLLRSVQTDDRELRRIVDEALLKLDRTTRREDRGGIDASARVSELFTVRYHCRRGLETILVDELDDLGARGVAPGVVEVKRAGSLASLFRPRTALRFAFPLTVPPQGDEEERVASAIVEGASFLKRFTKGQLTWRLEWVGRGHRRAATYRVASLVQQRSPEMRNDPTNSLWEILVDGDLNVEAWPKAAEDPRFVYRLADVPASSHPTIAAALAHVAGVRRDEVVWDPFVGSGTELIERARLGPVRSMYGCDLDPAALEAARQNLEAASMQALLVVSDARSSRPPEPVSLVITNPPMGRRVLDRKSLEPLFDGLLANVRASMRRDGRVVMLSPIPGRSVELAVRHGFRVERRGPIDLGGFDAELQILEMKRK